MESTVHLFICLRKLQLSCGWLGVNKTLLLKLLSLIVREVLAMQATSQI
jgi:hypothetical protein